MLRTTTIHNVSGGDKTYNGQLIADTETYTLADSENISMRQDTVLFTDIASGDVLIGNGTADFTDSTLGWQWLLGEQELPFSELGNKLGVHASSKPEQLGKEFYLVWTGAGDDVANHLIGEGDLLAFDFSIDNPVVAAKDLDIRFDPMFGDCYLHEGYLKNSGTTLMGASMTAMIMTEPCPLQQSAYLDLVVENNWIKYSSGGPGTGTHGFGGMPTLIKRSFMHDGDWNYDANSGLTPNFTGTGEYKISDIERVAHRYINKIPLCGDQGFTRLTSDETAYLPEGYFIRIRLNNPNQEALKAAFFFEVYRERTAVP